jgi:hypothetical protein
MTAGDGSVERPSTAAGARRPPGGATGRAQGGGVGAGLWFTAALAVFGALGGHAAHGAAY